MKTRPYKFEIFMYAIGTRFDTRIKAMNAYKSEKRAEYQCDQLNTYCNVDPVYGNVYYKVEPAF